MTIVDAHNGYWIVELDRREQAAYGYIYGVMDESGKLEDSEGAMDIDEALRIAAAMRKGGMRYESRYRKAHTYPTRPRNQ